MRLPRARRIARRCCDSIEQRWSMSVYHTCRGMRQVGGKVGLCHSCGAFCPLSPAARPHLERHVGLLVFQPWQRRVGARCQKAQKRAAFRHDEDMLVPVDLEQADDELRAAGPAVPDGR